MRYVTALAFSLLVGCQMQPIISTPTPARPPAGEEGRLQGALTTTVFFGADRKALDDYTNALTEDIAASRAGKEQTAAPALLSSGRVARVASQTRVLVLERDGPQTRVRVLDGAYAGREGWVDFDAVVRPSRQ